MLIEALLSLTLLAAAGATFVLVKRRRQASAGEADANRARDGLDTLAAWPPEVTRLLTSGERTAHETLVKALPECMIFSQVPLARFIRVPRRYSYADWLTRVGHLSADFLICDRASLVIAAVSLQTAQDSERAERRRARMSRVLKAAGVKVFVWREHAIPAPAAARDQIVQRTGVPGASMLESTAPQKTRRATAHGNVKIPVPEVLTEAPAGEARLEPPPSTWFDDLDSAPTPLGPAQKRPG
jgi:hypothetical protein